MFEMLLHILMVKKSGFSSLNLPLLTALLIINQIKPCFLCAECWKKLFSCRNLNTTLCFLTCRLIDCHMYNFKVFNGFLFSVPFPVFRVGGWKRPVHPVIWKGDEHQPAPHPSLPHSGVPAGSSVCHPLWDRPARQWEADQRGGSTPTTQLQPPWHAHDCHRPEGKTLKQIHTFRDTLQLISKRL